MQTLVPHTPKRNPYTLLRKAGPVAVLTFRTALIGLGIAGLVLAWSQVGAWQSNTLDVFQVVAVFVQMFSGAAALFGFVGLCFWISENRRMWQYRYSRWLDEREREFGKIED